MRRLVLLMLLCWTAGLSAQIDQSLVDADTLTVGARFTLILKADFPLESVSVPDSLEDFAVLAKDRISAKGTAPYFKITLSPLKTGALSFPGLRIKAAGAAGDYFSNGFRINVLAVRAEQDSVLRDLKPLRVYPLQRPLWLYFILPLLQLAFLIWILSTRKKPAPEPEKTTLPEASPPLLPPWEIALKALSALEAEDLLQTGDYRAFHYQLSMILRSFLEAHYRFSAQEMTSFEIRNSLTGLRLDSSSQIFHFLIFCDRVKFAKVMPQPSEISVQLQWLRQYLESFRQQTQEVPLVPLG